MQFETDEDKDISPAERLRLAKIEHYLQRVEEYVQMGRYMLARKALGNVLALDPANASCKGFQDIVEETLSQMIHRGNGSPQEGNGNAGGSERRKRSELILVVDQDERLLASLTETLKRYGFMAIAAGCYEEALETVSLVTPDLVISEVNFADGPKGFDLYMWLKTNMPQHDIPFMFLATRIDREMMIAGKRFGVDDLLLKPADDDVVTASIINCLARRKAQPSRA